MINIVELKKEHLNAVFHIEQECFSAPWSKNDLEKQLELETSHFLVALVDSQVVGYMGLQIFSGEGYVTNVAVLEPYRGQGIAQALIEKQLENDMDFITLEVRESNIPAINLYKKTGFQSMGVRPSFYSNPSENAVIMTKNMRDNKS